MVAAAASTKVVGMELTPLRRASSGAVLGGVCAGLARRWKVDPTVLRIAMVLLALLGGLGIAFYVGALLLVPKDGSSDFPLYRVAPFTRSWSPAAAIGAVVGLGVLITVAVGSWMPFGLAPAVGLGFLWYFGFHRRRQPQHPDAATGQAPDALPGGNTPAIAELPPGPQTDFERAAAAWRERVAQERPGSTGTLVTPAPLNDPYPTEPYPVQGLTQYRPTPSPAPPAVPNWTPPAPRATRNRPKWLWPLVLCLVGGGLATLAVLSAVVGVAVPALAYPATVLGALGLGLLVAAFAGRPRGLLPLSVVAALVTIAMMVPMPRTGRVGDETLTYTTMAQLPGTEQNHAAGDVTVDLTGLAITETRQFRYAQGVGTTTLVLPAAGNVVVEWSIGAGEYSGPDTERGGIDIEGTYRRITDPAAPVLTVFLHSDVGEVIVAP